MSSLGNPYITSRELKPPTLAVQIPLVRFLTCTAAALQEFAIPHAFRTGSQRLALISAGLCALGFRPRALAGPRSVLNSYFYQGFWRFLDNRKFPHVSVRDLQAQLQEFAILHAFRKIFQRLASFSEGWCALVFPATRFGRPSGCLETVIYQGFIMFCNIVNVYHRMLMNILLFQWFPLPFLGNGIKIINEQ